MSEARIKTYREFYPYYLSEHSNPTCRGLHYIGTMIGVGAILATIIQGQPLLLLVALVSGYSFAWVGHFFFEHNKPATFKYPLWSFISDFRMLWDWIMGRFDTKTA